MMDVEEERHHKEEMVSAELIPHLGILGAGNFGYALASVLKTAGVQFCLGTRKHGSLRIDGISVVSHKTVAETCDMIFLCIPSHAHEAIIDPLKEKFSQKIIVDVSNIVRKGDASNAERLQTILHESFVVKALNNLSAYHLENLEHGKETYICGNDETSKLKVSQVLRKIGISSVDRGFLSSAILQERMIHRFFPEWGTAIGITIIMFLLMWLYNYLWIFWYMELKNIEEDLPLYISNRLIAWGMFWLLALTYLPGPIAAFIQLFRGTKYRRFPKWLDKWMRSRKQLGLITLWLAGIHACTSCLTLGSGETVHMLKHTIIPNTTIIINQHLGLKHQVSLLFAVLAFALMVILGITSFPSVNNRMSWKEWQFVQSYMGYFSLIFGFVHVIVYVGDMWTRKWVFWDEAARHSKGMFPPAGFIMPMLPLLVIGLRLIFMLPGVSCYLSRIQSGMSETKCNRTVKVV